jgi:hypothetical protein
LTSDRRDGEVEFESPTRLSRALRALAHEAAVTEDGPHPLGEFEPSPSRVSAVVLAERATHVP